MLILLLIAAILMGTIQASATPTADNFGVEPLEIECYYGGPCEIPISIINPSEPIISIIFNMAYDRSVIDVIDVKNAELTSNWDTPAYNDNFSWGVRVAQVYDGTQRIDKSGILTTVVVNVTGVPGNKTTLSFSDIQLAGTDYSVGTAPARNSRLVIVTTGTLSGQITNVVGAGIADAELSIYDLDLNLVSKIYTNETGNYSLPLKIGYYFITAEKAHYYQKTTLINIKSGELKDLNFVLPLHGDFNNNGLAADAGDLAMMKDAAICEIVL